MAVGDFILLPEDDLVLATLLKSPLFDLNDNDLIAIAPNRKGALWSALLAAAETQPRFRDAAETLKRWRASADYAPPFEFYAEAGNKCSYRNACRNVLDSTTRPSCVWTCVRWRLPGIGSCGRATIFCWTDGAAGSSCRTSRERIPC
jgi:hypothetical protein